MFITLSNVYKLLFWSNCTYKFLVHILILFLLRALQRRHAKTVRDSSISYKIDYVVQVWEVLNPEGFLNCIIGFIAYWWSCIEKGLRMLPAQQDCIFLF